jgi:hypothetical protein
MAAWDSAMANKHTAPDDHPMHLRGLVQALKLVADAVRAEGEEHVCDALYSIGNSMETHIEALEDGLRTKQTD